MAPPLLAVALAAALLGPCRANLDDEVFVKLPSGGFAALSTTGRGAVRLRLVSRNDQKPMATPMVGPDEPDAVFERRSYGGWQGISSAFGSAVISSSGVLQLRNASGKLLAVTEPLTVGTGVLSFLTRSGELYGHGSSRQDASSLTSNSSKPAVTNTATWVPYYWSTDGYSALGVASGEAKQVYYSASYRISSNKSLLMWEYRGDFEIYLMPAATLRESTVAFFGLTGMPRIPPLYAFGFMASRWGWEDRAYVEATLSGFRGGNFPLDAIIMDFEWFVNETDYDYDEKGKPYYEDFGWNPVVWPKPREQLAMYHNEYNVRVGLLRKPRIGNSETLAWLKPQGYIADYPEPSGKWPPDYKHAYSKNRSLDFGQEAVRGWYSRQQIPYLDQGVDFWWNDEGETTYFNFYWWNIAELATLRSKNLTKRFFTLNRAFTPGMARLGVGVWTGDINPTWEDLQAQPGVLLNWALAGQPYIANDIGGFSGNSTPHLLARWTQMSVFWPLMRTHSTCSPWATPHWPWLWGESTAASMRQSLQLRYRLVPLHYSLAHHLYTTGELWIKPLAMEFPDDLEAAKVTNQWMDGPILVAPITTNDSQRAIYIPEGSWYSLRASEINEAPKHCKTCFRTLYRPRGLTHRSVDLIEGPVHMGGTADYAELPAFVRTGTVLPLAPVVQYTDALPGGPLEVQVYSGADGSFEMVEDDGETTSYEDGHVRTTRFRWDDESRTLSWEVQGPLFAGGFPRAFQHLFVTMFSGRTDSVQSETKPISTHGSIQLMGKASPGSVAV